MEDCVFCKIINRDIPSTRIYEDNRIIAIRDLKPQAPEHILFFPKAHIASADEIDESNSDLIAHIFSVIPEVAAQIGLKNGYRIVNNCGEDGCQTVRHLHFHLLGGKKLDEKMV